MIEEKDKERGEREEYERRGWLRTRKGWKLYVKRTET